jgi:hypothetical protein
VKLISSRAYREVAFFDTVHSGGRMVAEERYTAIPTIENAMFCYWREAA